MAVNAQKRLETCYKNGGIATQNHNIEVQRPTTNIQKIVGTELGLETINSRVYGLVTRHPDR